MLTPIVTEIARAAEPVVRDTFIREFEGRPVRRRSAPTSLGRTVRRSRPAAVSARAS